MEKIIPKLEKTNSKGAIDKIINIYRSNLFCVVNFLYFFNLLKIIEDKNQKYEQALLNSDIILPDGIALRLYFKKKFKIDLKNLNGTDFTPYFLENIKNKEVILYGTTKQNIKKVFEKFKNQRNIIYFQNGYTDFDWDKLNLSKDKIKIMLVGLGTPKQEIWIQNNLDKIKENNLIVLGVGGLFDFLAGDEKRAPKIIRNLNLERAWRAATKPKKNLKKTLETFKLFKYLYLK